MHDYNTLMGWAILIALVIFYIVGFWAGLRYEERKRAIDYDYWEAWEEGYSACASKPCPDHTYCNQDDYNNIRGRV